MKSISKFIYLAVIFFIFSCLTGVRNARAEDPVPDCTGSGFKKCSILYGTGDGTFEEYFYIDAQSFEIFNPPANWFNGTKAKNWRTKIIFEIGRAHV